MILRYILIILFLFSLDSFSKDSESQSNTLSENATIIKEELKKRKFLLQSKKLQFRLMNKERVQFILVKYGRMFSTGIGVVSDEKNEGYKIAVYELFDPKNLESLELIQKFSVTDKIFVREIHDTSLYYLIEIEMTTDNQNGSVVELVHGFSSVRLNSINKNPPENQDMNAGLCDFGNCGIITRMNWNKK